MPKNVRQKTGKGLARTDRQKTLIQRLEEFGRQLRQLPRPTRGKITGVSQIDIGLADFVAAALENFTSGKAKSLDAAFGLKKRTGRPVTKGADHDAIAQKAFEMQREGKSWEQIVVEISATLPDTMDERTLRRIYVARLPALAAKILGPEIIQELKDELKSGGPR